jgi:hypothetical protein
LKNAGYAKDCLKMDGQKSIRWPIFLTHDHFSVNVFLSGEAAAVSQ